MPGAGPLSTSFGNGSFVLRLATFTYKPYHVVTREGLNEPIGGMFGKVVDVLSSYLKIDYEVIDGGSWGRKLDNGSWNGATGFLARNEADILLCTTMPSDERFSIAAPSPVLHPIEIIVLAGRKTRFLKTPFSLINGFSPQVWLVLIFTALFLAGAMALVHRLLNDSPGLFTLLNSYILRLFASTWGVGTRGSMTSDTLRILWISWLLGVTMILMHSFAGNLKGKLLIKEEAPRITGLLDLYKRPRMKIYLPINSLENMLKSSEAAYVRSIYRRIVHEHRTALPVREILQPKPLSMILSGQAVLLMSRPAAARAVSSECKRLTQGEYYTGRDTMFSFLASIFYNRRMPIELQTAVSHVVTQLYEAGFLIRWYESVAGKWSGCTATGTSGVGYDDQPDPLQLSDMEGVFYIGLIGHAVATLALLTEIISLRRRSTPGRKQPPESSRP